VLWRGVTVTVRQVLDGNLEARRLSHRPTEHTHDVGFPHVQGKASRPEQANESRLGAGRQTYQHQSRKAVEQLATQVGVFFASQTHDRDVRARPGYESEEIDEVLDMTDGQDVRLSGQTLAQGPWVTVPEHDSDLLAGALQAPDPPKSDCGVAVTGHYIRTRGRIPAQLNDKGVVFLQQRQVSGRGL